MLTLACLTAQQIRSVLMGQGFGIWLDAVVSLYFEPVQPGKASRVLHVDLKPTGSTARDMEEADAHVWWNQHCGHSASLASPTAIEVDRGISGGNA